MGRRRTPSYEPQSFETRHGEWTIERGRIRIDEGPSWLARRAVDGVWNADLEALGKPAMVPFTLFGAVWTLHGTITRVTDGSVWPLVFGSLIAVALAWQCYRWLRPSLLGPSEIRCSDVESVTRVADDSFRIEYKEGPRYTQHTVRLPQKDTDEARHAARSAFERKGFEVERDEREPWYRELV